MNFFSPKVASLIVKCTGATQEYCIGDLATDCSRAGLATK